MILRHAGVRLWLVAMVCTGLLVPATAASAAISTSDLRLLIRAEDDPTVSPLDGATAEGAIRVVVRPESKVSRVVLALDGRTIADDRSAPFFTSVDTSDLTDGPHAAVAAVTASDGTQHTLRASFSVANDTTPAPTSDLRLLVRDDADPTVSPLHGATVDGTIRFVVRPEHQISRVLFKLDGATIADDRSAPFYVRVDTTDLADGSHTTATSVTTTDGANLTLRGDFTVENGSQDRTVEPAPDSPSTTTADDILLVVGAPGSLNGSERQIRDRLRSRSYDVSIADDDNTKIAAGAYDLVIISKTVKSTKIRDRFKATTTSVMTWEDNAQAIEQGGTVGRLGTGTKMLAWNNAINPTGTSWHGRDQVWRINPNAPLELRKGLSGRTTVYGASDEMTYAPANTLPASATVVASYGKDTARTTYYVYREGAKLPDGSLSTGRRIYFGLYDDTFKRLNDSGLKLFDAAVDWGARS